MLETIERLRVSAKILTKEQQQEVDEADSDYDRIEGGKKPQKESLQTGTIDVDIKKS